MVAKEIKAQGTGTSNYAKLAIIMSLVISVLMAAAFFFDGGRNSSTAMVVSAHKQKPMPKAHDTVRGDSSAFKTGGNAKEQRRKAPAAKKETSALSAGPVEANPEVSPTEHPKDINEIKKQIYDLNIEYVEDMGLLDEVVQTGDADTKPFWSGEWISVDDFKGEDNGFNLKPQKDGTYIFYPDEETARTYTFFESPRTYTYDEEHKEFYWEEDYYGKTITHKAKFINDNVLATMLISGNKVTLDIYQKTPEQYE